MTLNPMGHSTKFHLPESGTKFMLSLNAINCWNVLRDLKATTWHESASVNA